MAACPLCILGIKEEDHSPELWATWEKIPGALDKVREAWAGQGIHPDATYAEAHATLKAKERKDAGGG